MCGTRKSQSDKEHRRGASVEFTQPDPELPGEWKMMEATGPCRISIITKKQQLSAGSTRYITSVWVISDDRGVRMQQKRMCQ